MDLIVQEKNMKIYDVIIIGGGPAGLKCAETLGQTDKTVLLLEKKPVFGDRLCAGGLTKKDMDVLPLPDEVIEYKISRTALHSRRQSTGSNSSTPFLYTVNRKKLGEYQGSLLKDLGVEVQMNSQVTRIEKDKVILKNGREYGYKFLVGAEGYSSSVRKYLKLPVRKKLIGFQYTIPVKQVDPVLKIYLDSRRFKYWYAWVFPHNKSIAVGCCCDPSLANHQKIKSNFEDWLKHHNIDPGNARLESYPISYDYVGHRFDNIFLAGEAAGLASGLTGEGIYQSLVSGQEIAKMILDPNYQSEAFTLMLKYNRILKRVMFLFRIAGPFRDHLFEFFLFLMNNQLIRKRINANFS
jgi:geranylgeranyl reductase